MQNKNLKIEFFFRNYPLVEFSPEISPSKMSSAYTTINFAGNRMRAFNLKRYSGDQRTIAYTDYEGLYDFVVKAGKNRNIFDDNSFGNMVDHAKKYNVWISGMRCGGCTGKMRMQALIYNILYDADLNTCETCITWDEEPGSPIFYLNTKIGEAMANDQARIQAYWKIRRAICVELLGKEFHEPEPGSKLQTPPARQQVPASAYRQVQPAVPFARIASPASATASPASAVSAGTASPASAVSAAPTPTEAFPTQSSSSSSSSKGRRHTGLVWENHSDSPASTPPPKKSSSYPEELVADEKSQVASIAAAVNAEFKDALASFAIENARVKSELKAALEKLSEAEAKLKALQEKPFTVDSIPYKDLDEEQIAIIQLRIGKEFMHHQRANYPELYAMGPTAYSGNPKLVEGFDQEQEQIEFDTPSSSSVVVPVPNEASGKDESE